MIDDSKYSSMFNSKVTKNRFTFLDENPFNEFEREI